PVPAPALWRVDPRSRAQGGDVSMSNAVADAPSVATVPPDFLALLRCPASGVEIEQRGDTLVARDGSRSYRLTASGIPLFAEELCSPDARIQQAHYDKVPRTYVANLSYPHTIEYMAYLDRVLLDAVGETPLGTGAEICCGHGEAVDLLGPQLSRYVGVD